MLMTKRCASFGALSSTMVFTTVFLDVVIKIILWADFQSVASLSATNQSNARLWVRFFTDTDAHFTLSWFQKFLVAVPISPHRGMRIATRLMEVLHGCQSVSRVTQWRILTAALSLQLLLAEWSDSLTPQLLECSDGVIAVDQIAAIAAWLKLSEGRKLCANALGHCTQSGIVAVPVAMVMVRDADHVFPCALLECWTGFFRNCDALWIHVSSTRFQLALSQAEWTALPGKFQLQSADCDVVACDIALQLMVNMWELSDGNDNAAARSEMMSWLTFLSETSDELLKQTLLQSGIQRIQLEMRMRSKQAIIVCKLFTLDSACVEVYCIGHGSESDTIEELAELEKSVVAGNVQACTLKR